MNTLEHNRFTESWAEFGSSIPKPKAILAISAHWYIDALAVTSMPNPRTIHDFTGFPQPLFDFQYPAPGDPILARRVCELLNRDVIQDEEAWGIDHGTWSVLAHMFPNADVPVVQLSIERRKSLEEHLAIGRSLHDLRSEGILILCSGNVVHNLSLMDWSRPDDGFEWALDFDASVRDVMSRRPQAAIELSHHPMWSKAVPTPDHFLPLMCLAGLADASSSVAEVLIGGPAFGSLTMTSFVLSDRISDTNPS